MRIFIGSSDKSRGIIDYNQSGKLQRPAWKAVHIACDVGNRVHTRHDSDEDVRGNACNQAIALWLYLDIHRDQLPFLACVLKINQDKHPILCKLSFFEF